MIYDIIKSKTVNQFYCSCRMLHETRTDLFIYSPSQSFINYHMKINKQIVDRERCQIVHLYHPASFFFIRMQEKKGKISHCEHVLTHDQLVQISLQRIWPNINLQVMVNVPDVDCSHSKINRTEKSEKLYEQLEMALNLHRTDSPSSFHPTQKEKHWVTQAASSGAG